MPFDRTQFLAELMVEAYGLRAPEKLDKHNNPLRSAVEAELKKRNLTQQENHDQ